MIDWLLAQFPINRIIALLSPLLVSASGYIAVWTTQHVAWLHLDQAQLTAVFIAGVTAGLTVIYKWLHGWQAAEARGETQK